MSNDDAPATDRASRALRVSSTRLPDLAPGDRVLVGGRVDETGRRGGLPVTSLVGGRFRSLGTGELPAAVALGAGGRSVPNRHVDDDGLWIDRVTTHAVPRARDGDLQTVRPRASQ